MRKLQVCTVLSMMSFYSLAQYRSTITNLNRVLDPPGNEISAICNKYRNTGSALALDACRNAIQGARYMAEKYARGAGEYLGCVDGFTQGLYAGYMQTKDPDANQTQEAVKRYENVEMSSAVEIARRQADEKGHSVAAGQIIKKFREALKRGVQPQKKYNYPQINIQSELNKIQKGYEKDAIGGSFSPVYQEGWVTSKDSHERRAVARNIYEMKKEAHHQSRSLCDNTKTIFGRRKLVQLTLWDYFRARGVSDFEDYGWSNAQWALDLYTSSIEGNADSYLKYQGMRDWTKLVEVTVVVKPEVPAVYETKTITDEAGKPVLDANGKPKTERVKIKDAIPAVTKKEKVTKPISSDDLRRLQGIYNDSFKIAYSNHYAAYYASLEYHKTGQDKFRSAKLTGIALGKLTAKDIADMRAYNDRYDLVFTAKFNERVRGNYEKEFNSIWNRFADGSVIELNSVNILGDVDDNIYRPGEGLFANIQATNLGLVPGRFMGRLSGASLNQIQEQQFNIQGLSQDEYTSGVLANISESAEPRKSIVVRFDIFGNIDSSDLLNVSEEDSILINEVAEISAIELDNTHSLMTNGSSSITVDVSNPSSRATTALVKVKLTINGKTFEAEDMHLAAGEIRPVTVNISGFDPVELFTRVGHLKVKVQTFMNNKKLDGGIKVFPLGNKQNNAAQLFALNAVKNANLETMNRLAQMIKSNAHKFVKQNRKFKWHKYEKASQTLVYELGVLYQNLRSEGKMNSIAEDHFQKLGREIASENLCLIKGGFLGFGKKKRRKGFVREIKTFASNIDYKSIKKIARRY